MTDEIDDLRETDESLREQSSGDTDRFVWSGDPFDSYHITDAAGDPVCGADIESMQYFSDPGDVIDRCETCPDRGFDRMTNAELVAWLADVCDYEPPQRDYPAYMSSEELQAICEHIRELRSGRRKNNHERE